MNAQINAAHLGRDTALPMFGAGAALTSLAILASLLSTMMAL